ncbi:FkbM family methyltransferase [Paracoccus luteus]|uniref:FkbM family methyltransferase n=1 Tax=Paracoccus luteus TaxID=2508543 RepID=UPI001070045D|nr:FkbM family methyltransferase [Paracoccus luteus]
MSEAIDLPRPELTDASYFDAAAARAALASGGPVAFPPFDLVHWGGLTFALNYRRDPVQNAIREGRFYELPELRTLKGLVAPGATIVDIGANVGNHALFFARRMRAARVIVFEPNPLAAAPLMANVLLNGLAGVVCLDHLGVALGAGASTGFGMRRHDRNLGATRLRPGEGCIPVCRGDDLLTGETPALIKIDVEGMEMEVLAGLSATIARARPLMMVEVDDANLAAFLDWQAAAGYRPVKDWRVSKSNANYLIEPRRDDTA